MPGTGKSTVVKYIVSALDIDETRIVYATYTGKASLVLRQKGCLNAMTLHKLLYKSFKKKDGTFVHIPKTELEEDYLLIIVDEISMVPKKIWDLLLTHNVHVICLGDPFQLPPIGEDNGVLAKPHVFLDEIMRQAQESEIIRLTMDIREGKRLELYKGNEVRVIKRSEIVTGLYTWADQIICGKNNTRRTINDQMREILGRGSQPENGDKVICLHNEWETFTDAGDVLVNGSIGELSNVKIGRDGGILGTPMVADFVPDFFDEREASNSQFDSVFRALEMDYRQITEGIPTQQQNNFKYRGKAPILKSFDYGYAITCHKAQGSEYPKVLVFEEVLRRDLHARWLYTSATRAMDKLIVIPM